ncbi:GntR family transcriptional regulator [Desulfosarcina alkanivorans]|jgi:GntR family transcriptional regulator|uniref:GntR family transcriptional regulator n=1 Tax=Desulfosarcina alkanivorans TaxID=571177 RepID=A0A5K7YRR4_9BACT|nr:GntR family transcriptional regulator [Desulfosarcina alkanivorans]BBO70619.1 GntR family transcriptional regulator [Desulfosarcina alkanivorans]
MLKTAPKYALIKDDLIEGVASRRFHDRLPSENELARRHGVSRMTARKALNELVRDGVARRIPGKGTFLKKRNFTQAYFRIHPFSENARFFNVSTRSRLIRAGIVDLPPELDAQLPGKEAVFLRRIHYLDEQPACHELRYLRADLCATILDEDLAVESVHDLLAMQLGLPVSRVWQRLEATGLDAAMAAELDSPTGAPVFCMHQRLYSDNRPVSYVIYHMRSDLYAFEDTFSPPPEGVDSRLGMLKTAVADQP